jgi:signal peptidase II
MDPMHPSKMGRWAALALAGLVIVLDQATKAWAVDALGVEGASRPLLGWLHATLVFNRSNAFGVVPVSGEISRWGLVAFNLIVAAALVWWMARRSRHAASLIAASFLAAGAVGNAVDRIRIGHVVDFLSLSQIGFHWVFNLADVSVDVGIGFLILNILIGQEETAGEAPGQGVRP